MSDILPFEKTTTTVITSFTIMITDVVLFTSVRVRVDMFDQNQNRVDCTFLIIEGEDYAQWGTDDQYIINYVCEKMGFARKPEEILPTEEIIPSEDIVPTEDIVPSEEILPSENSV